MATSYHDVYARWRRDPERFWAEAAESVDWIRPWSAVLDSSRAPFFRWFPGAAVNTCYNAVDRHVERGRAGQTAVIYDSPVTATVRSRARRSRRHLPADGPRGDRRHAGLCPHRCGALARVRRLRAGSRSIG